MEGLAKPDFALVRRGSKSLADKLSLNAAGLAMIVWSFIMGVRRFVDYNSSFHSISILSLVPLAVLVPGVWYTRKFLPRFGSVFTNSLKLWLVGFGYAFFISVMTGGALPALFELGSCLFPIAMATYLVWNSNDFETAYNRFLETMFWSSFVAALYGIYQYVSPPGWDIYWLTSTHIVSMGTPEPFGLRIFGTLNSSGTMAQLMTYTIVLNLPRFTLAKRLHLLAVIPMLMALLFTLSRTCWLQLILGIVVYIMLTPQRKDALRFVGAVAVIGVLTLSFLAARSSDSAGALDGIVNRFSTLGSLQTDDSYQVRQQILSNGIREAFENPLGQGLGLVGTAAKLGSTGDTVDFDNGYLARLYEMGFLGAAPLFAGLLFPLWQTIALARRADVAPEHKALLAVAAAVQIMLLFGEIGEDVYIAINGMFFWVEVGLVSGLVQTYGASAKSLTRRDRVEHTRVLHA